mmetsp:Transcript_449/g.826  ORF Transcript_449/g.826 Transcript_449/m.826 type:complete len:255 (-) Transcript_449:530-1294(-)
MASIRVVPVPVLSDNYAYLVIDEATKVAAAVDPAEPDKVLAAARREGVTVQTVLTTHKHWDHSSGNEAMASRIPGLDVVGGEIDAVPAATRNVRDQDTFPLASGSAVQVRALATPCHTRGHICYFVEQGGPHVFTGDTLFIGGCGRFFEGGAVEMYHALVEILAELPGDTQVWCGHEYTRKNLDFAVTVEPGNEALQRKRTWAYSVEQTIPSSIAGEREINVFMRVNSPQLQAVVGVSDPIQALAILRERKDQF